MIESTLQKLASQSPQLALGLAIARGNNPDEFHTHDPFWRGAAQGVELDSKWHNGSNTMWYALLAIDPQAETVLAKVQNNLGNAQKIDAAAQAIMGLLRK